MQRFFGPGLWIVVCAGLASFIAASAHASADVPAATQPSAPDAPAAAEPHAPPPRPSPTLIPPRPPPLIELGAPFFGTGPVPRAIELPTGAVWLPNLTVFGTYRSAFQAFRDPLIGAGAVSPPPAARTRSEWANRLDLFVNLQLSGTERVLLGFQPFDNAVFSRPALAKYTGYQFGPEGTEGWVYRFEGRPTTLFFEGDLGQIFPRLDPKGNGESDIGFSVGRQPLLYQDGLLIDDDVDAVGITRNTFLPRGGSNLQVTGVYGWSQINAGDGIRHDERALLGLFFTADVRPGTFNLDLVYVNGGSGGAPDGLFAGFSAVQRVGDLNLTLRALTSRALGRATPDGTSAFSAYGNGSSALANGVLLFGELSYTPPATNDLIYLDPYLGIDRFTSAARGPDRGGPLGRVGILFAEQPIGRYGSALPSSPERSYGAALGYQKFLDPQRRRQLTLEVGGREPTGGGDHRHGAGAAAAGGRYQQAFGQHVVLQFDAFASINEGRGPGYGGRAEVRVEF